MCVCMCMCVCVYVCVGGEGVENGRERVRWASSADH